jgi:hypothetical protein
MSEGSSTVAPNSMRSEVTEGGRSDEHQSMLTVHDGSNGWKKCADVDSMVGLLGAHV